MKKILVHERFKQDWIQVLTHIANLFFEDSKLYESIEDPDLSVHFQYKQENNCYSTACQLEVDGKTFYSTYSKQYDSDGNDREQNIRMKRALSHVLLDVL